MATSFPGSQDSFSNPSSGSSLSSPSHSQQHSDVNDAVEAIEGALLDGAPLHIDDANERVGIGTTSPTYKLHVTGGSSNDTTPEFVIDGNGSMAFHNGLGQGSYNSIVQAGDMGIIFTDGTQNTGEFVIAPWATGAKGLRIDSSGNVGINQGSPTFDLDVVGRGRFAEGNNSYIFFGPNNTWGANLYVGSTDNKSTTSTAQVISTNGNLHLDCGTGNHTYINFYQQSSDVNLFGNVAVGGQSPVYRLDVNGPEDTASRININSGNTANRYLMRFSRNGGLLANGIYADTGTAYFGTPSDVNLKTGIETISTSDALTALNALRAVDYRYLLDAEDVVRKGFIAQEVEEVIPEAVKRVGGGHQTTQLMLDENGDLQYESVDENGDLLLQEEPDIILNWEPITTTLVAAVQELSATVQTLTARIEALEAG